MEAKSNRPEDALGRSDAFVSFQQQLSKVAKVDRPVLIIGERGSGKELAVVRLHYLSQRWREPLVTLNCAALAPTLIATELFGHEAGAFTGAAGRRSGRFEAANLGTLFLDEIGNIPMEVQEKILRVVEYGTFERVGSTRPVQVDVRIIGATHSDLLALAEQNRFKRDLLDRLSFEVLFLPPLRNRQEDILLLANHFAARMAHELGRTAVPEFSDLALQALEGYQWPGNIRELKNVVERAVYRAEEGPIQEIEFNPFLSPYQPRIVKSPDSPQPAMPVVVPDDPGPKPLAQAVRELEIGMLEKALKQGRHNQKRAAQLLGLTYHQFRGLYRKYLDRG